MAHLDDGKQSWDDDERSYSSGRDSDDSPILSYRYDRNRRYSSYTKEDRCEEPHRRSTITVLAKFFLFCTAMILFCVLMYIPVYNKASDQLPKGLVAGWSIHTNRDTKIYVQPNNVTTIHEPKDICQKKDRHKKNKLFLLIVVCSATTNFDRRIAIRETWGNRDTYQKIYSVYTRVRDKYKDYNYTYDLYPESRLNVSLNVNKTKRDISIGRLLPELAKALQSNMADVKTDTVPEEKRFDDEDDPVLPEFDMNKELGEQTEDYDYEYETNNIMRIPPRGGYEDSPSLGKILKMLKDGKVFTDKLDKEPPLPVSDVEPEFNVVFLLGLPPQNNDTEVQNKIDEEVEKYGDVIQEGFIDSYNNLTLKSIMMLKWISNNCNESVRYILKTDDDMYINVPNLMLNLKNRSREFDGRVASGRKEKEYMLIGDLICGARPVLDSSNKWYSPRYMYGGRVYPRYLSGTGYALSVHAASALYTAALTTNYFHLEDIYITGMCALRASPRILPRDDPTFSYQNSLQRQPCLAHAQATAHRVQPRHMRRTHHALMRQSQVDTCERWRLTQIKLQRQKLYVVYKYLRMLVSEQC